MGKTTRRGFRYGMDMYEAQRNFHDELNRSYGEDSYQGGGNDIREWLKAECIQVAVPASAPKKTKSVKIQPKASGKLVNGFIVTNETPELLRHQMSVQYNNTPAPVTIEGYALTQTEAKKKADEMAKKCNATVFVLPGRLWQDDRTKRLSLPNRVLEVTPSGGKEAKPGKWRFEVEVSI